MATTYPAVAHRCGIIIAAQDTAEVDFAGRSRARRSSGPAGNGISIHPVVAMEAEDMAWLELLAAKFELPFLYAEPGVSDVHSSDRG